MRRRGKKTLFDSEIELVSKRGPQSRAPLVRPEKFRAFSETKLLTQARADTFTLPQRVRSVGTTGCILRGEWRAAVCS